MTLYPWQQRVWQMLWQRPDCMPTSLLLYGPTGIGKNQFAEYLSKALLCQARSAAHGVPCGGCQSCLWFDHRTHPDVHRISLNEADASENGDKNASKRGKSGHIGIEQIRSLDDFLYRTTHLGGPRLVIMDPIDRLYPNAAHAFLKKLEEPPANTYYLLITTHRHHLLPTILSRCCAFCPGIPSQADARQWLIAQGIHQPEKWLARAGSPLLAKRLSETEQDPSSMVIQEWSMLNRQNALSIAEGIDKRLTAEKSVDALEQFVIACQMVCHDLVRMGFHLPIRYHPDAMDELKSLVIRTNINTLLLYEQVLLTFRQSARHPLNTRLFVEDMLLKSPFV